MADLKPEPEKDPNASPIPAAVTESHQGQPLPPCPDAPYPARMNPPPEHLDKDNPGPPPAAASAHESGETTEHKAKSSTWTPSRSKD